MCFPDCSDCHTKVHDLLYLHNCLFFNLMVMADDHMSAFHCTGSNNLNMFLNISLHILLNKDSHMIGKVENSKSSSEGYLFF